MRALIVHLVADEPWHVGFTFSAADVGNDIADAIGAAFDTVLMTSRHNEHFDMDKDWDQWGQRARRCDFRVMYGTGWNIVDKTTVPISIFEAGGSVTQAPEW